MYFECKNLEKKLFIRFALEKYCEAFENRIK